jgi:polygalacturonase
MHPATEAIAVYSSKNVLIENNIFGGNGRAVTAAESDARLKDDKHGWQLSNVVIQNNTLNGDVIVGCTATGVQCSGNV